MRDGHRGVGNEKVLLHINVAIDFLAIAFLCSGKDQLRTMTIGDSDSMTKPRLISSHYMQHGIEWRDLLLMVEDSAAGKRIFGVVLGFKEGNRAIFLLSLFVHHEQGM